MTDAWTSWPAPAKLNLFLHVVGRRADGYHELQTLFQLLDWGDTVKLAVRNDGEIHRTVAIGGVPAETDLSLRAARALQSRTGTRLGADIALDKRIPLGGGLGGGSSDAATVLVGLNELWRTGLTREALADIGRTLGADVPVFVRGRSAWAEGIGDELTAVESEPRHFVVLDPRVHVPTAALFQAPELTRNSPRLTISNFLAGAKTSNAFEPLVRARYPQVGAALDWLGQFGDARLTGSGGCIFLALESAAAADAIAGACPSGFDVYRARGLSRSPLLEAVASVRAARGAMA